MRLAHIALSVSSIDKSLAFYKRHFGFRLKERYLHKDIGLVIAVIRQGDINLELFEFKRRKSLPAYRKKLDSDLRTVGVKHFSLAVTHIDKAYKRLKKSQVKFATPLRIFDNGLRYFFVRDPDGILLEIMEKRRG